MIRYYFLLIIIQILNIHTKYKLYIQNINYIYIKNIYRITTYFLTYEKISTIFQQKNIQFLLEFWRNIYILFLYRHIFYIIYLKIYITLYFIYFIFILFLYTKYIHQGVTYLLYGILIKFI